MWSEVLERNYFLTSLYNDLPELKNVRISEVMIQDEGRVVAIVFDLPIYAEKPPEKWRNLSDNTICVRVDFSAVREISIASGLAEYKGDIEIFKDELELTVVRITGTVNALIKADSGFVQSVTSYYNE